MLSGSWVEPAETRFKDFACPLRHSPLDLSLQPLNPYDITYAKSPRQYPITARASRVFIFILVPRPGTRSNLLDLLVRVRRIDDRGALESFHKSWTARLGSNCSNSKHVFRLQGRRPARLVGNPDVHSFCESYHLDHPLHRCGKELRKRCRLWNRLAAATDYFLSNSRLWQRPVSRPFGFARGRGFSTSARCLAASAGSTAYQRASTPS